MPLAAWHIAERHEALNDWFDDGSSLAEDLRRQVAIDLIRTRELRNLKLDGSVITIEVTSLPFDYQGAPAVLTQLRDITARKQAEQRVARLTNLYVALSRSNEAMVA